LGTSLKIDVASADEIVGFDENLDLKGMEYFTPLFNAIIDKRPLQLTYKSFKQEEKSKIIVHPYYLKQYNKRWFLIAWNAELNFLANFALDRILAIKEAKVPFLPADIDFFEYFDDMIGVSKDSRTELQKVKLWVSAAQWPYVKTKPLHGTQRVVKHVEDGTVITIEVYLNYELEQLLLSFGEKVRVLAPQELKDRLKQRLTEAANNYLEQVQYE
jgi:predicted DNA-binding transcriptional regulator YafY